MKTSNPVLARLGQAAEQGRSAGYAPQGPYGQPGYPQAGYPQPGYGQPYPAAPGYPPVPPTVTPMTVDDVVVKSVMLLGVLALVAAATWMVVPLEMIVPAWIGAAVVTLVLGLVISFSKMANPALVIAYSVFEGVLVGAISKAYETFFDGVVLQAVIATTGVFILMSVLYKVRAIRATPKFVRIVMGATLGLCAVMLVNLVLWFFGINTGLRDGSPLAIGFSLVCIVVASLNFVVEFHNIEEGVRAGLPQRYSWVAAFGILVGLVWLYLEFLRLLSYLQDD